MYCCCCCVIVDLQEVDLVAAQLTTTYERSLVVDFTTSISKDPMTAVIPAPTEDSYMVTIISVNDV